jgi:hypothetical protein
MVEGKSEGKRGFRYNCQLMLWALGEGIITPLLRSPMAEIGKTRKSRYVEKTVISIFNPT